MNEHAVVIAGGGPTGLMLAAELALAGTEALIVEPRLTQELESSRAGGLHARTIEVLDQRGVAERFLAEGQTHPFVGYAGITLDISDAPSRHSYVLALWQSHVERILADWVLGDLEVPIRRGCAVIGVAQDGTGVRVHLSDGTALAAQYLVGCDGGRSVVRKAAGIEFAGWDATQSFLIAEFEVDQEPEVGMRPEGGGLGPVDPGEGGPYRAALLEPEVEHDDEPTLQDLRDALIRLYGTDYGAHSPIWISRFTDMSRQAASYRAGRVLVAGDAAHVHSPHGGQGLNTGVQDAVNLGWKLAQVVAGTSPDSLLDSYHAERHPVAHRVLRNTMAQVALLRVDERSQALRDAVLELLDMDAPRRRIAGMISALDVHYDLGGGHPLVGRRMPDLDLDTADGPTRACALLHDARPVLLNLGDPGAVDGAGLAERVHVVDATYDGGWELPVIGEVAGVAAALIRPDGHVAWAGDPTDAALPEVAATWFGSR